MRENWMERKLKIPKQGAIFWQVTLCDAITNSRQACGGCSYRPDQGLQIQIAPYWRELYQLVQMCVGLDPVPINLQKPWVSLNWVCIQNLNSQIKKTRWYSDTSKFQTAHPSEFSDNVTYSVFTHKWLWNCVKKCWKESYLRFVSLGHGEWVQGQR